jgi:hypothetical protein
MKRAVSAQAERQRRKPDLESHLQVVAGLGHLRDLAVRCSESTAQKKARLGLSHRRSSSEEHKEAKETFHDATGSVRKLEYIPKSWNAGP